MDSMPEPVRSCGTCFACCVFLGITVLEKHPGRACKNLDGRDPAHRCTIYANRPLACSTFQCYWLAGGLSDDSRPDKSGILTSIYARPDIDHEPKIGVGNDLAATITVFGRKIAGSLRDPTSHLKRAIDDLTGRGINDIRIISYQDTGMVWFHDGEIFMARREANATGDFEGLNFLVAEPAIGRYEMQERNLE